MLFEATVVELKDEPTEVNTSDNGAVSRGPNMMSTRRGGGGNDTRFHERWKIDVS